MMPLIHARSRGFSLIEMVASLVIVSVIAGVLAPVLNSAADEIAAARDLRQASDDAMFAMASVTRILREASAGDGVNLGLSSADSTTVVFLDGRGVRLRGDILEMLTDAGAAPLARGVTHFEVIYVAADGMTPCPPQDAQRFHVTLTVRGLTLAGVVFARVNTGQVEGSAGGLP